jgi:uncharacterized SAM-binding protein YcdF (DUF218 family)
MATDALLGVLAAFVLAQLAPWGTYDVAGTIVSVILGAVGGLVIGRFFRPRVLIGIDVLLIAVYLIVTWTPIVGPFTSRWIRVDSLPADTLDAVVALSAGLMPDSALNAVGADRLLRGLELMRAGRARRIITTRVITPMEDRTVTSDSDQTRLISLAGLADKWTVVLGAQTTRDEAVLTSQLLLPRGEKRIVVVTSPLHTRRACAVFEAVGFTVVCRGSLERDNVTNHPSGQHDRLAALHAYAYELVAYVKYRARGWLTPHPVVTQGVGGSS